VLDPDRPKNDKATILGDSVQVVKELRAEVKRLKCEQTTLLDESRDLAQEKTELREEKAALKTETEQLQAQLEQRLCGMLPWMSVDPSTVVMGAGPYPYPMPVPQPVTGPTSGQLPPTSETPQLPHQPLAAPPTYLSMAPPGTFMHPGLQAYTMYGTQHSEQGGPFMPYPHYPAVGNHPHVERPYAQYPSAVQPVPSYLVQMQAPQEGAAANPSDLPMYRPSTFAVPVVVAGQSRSHPHVPFPQYPSAGIGQSYASHVSSRPTATSPEPQGVETSLQLQTPGGPSPSPSVAHSPSHRKTNAGGARPQSSGSESSSPVLKSENNGATQVDCSGRAGDAISTLTLASSSLSHAADTTLSLNEGT
jgi:FtsZ-binding cell division protein ZapB